MADKVLQVDRLNRRIISLVLVLLFVFFTAKVIRDSRLGYIPLLSLQCCGLVINYFQFWLVKRGLLGSMIYITGLNLEPVPPLYTYFLFS